MVFIKSVSAKSIPDSRGEKTIEIFIDASAGKFSASSPTGKSTGKYEAKPYRKSLDEDIKKIKEFSDYFSKDTIDKFDDLKAIEDVLDGHVGANTKFAFESAVLKALAREQEKEIWHLINKNAKKFPRLVGNCVGGGKHSNSEKKPDFQEFLLIPDKKSFAENFELSKKSKDIVERYLDDSDEKFRGEKNDEDAWQTSLNEKEVFEILKKLGIPLGVDIASSGFYSRKKYLYKNPMLKRSVEEQMDYVSNLIGNFNLYYIEDPFDEDDFESFSGLARKFPNRLIVGDDLTTTNYERLKKAIKMKSISGLIVKPNQIGSLIEVKSVCELAKKNNIKIIFSHRSGETEESILADLAFGFEADFLKCGITGKEREIKIRRLMEIERSFER